VATRSAVHQPGILAPLLPLGRSLTFRLAVDADPSKALRRLQSEFSPDCGVVGLGLQVVQRLGRTIPGLRPFPALSGPSANVPATQNALWVMLRGNDRGGLFDLTRQIAAVLVGGIILDDAMDTFVYAGGRDLTGYEDGTENPKGKAASSAALVTSGEGIRGSSFVAVQRWQHDLKRFAEFSPARRDNIIGRRRGTNEELGGAPKSAHVKRTAQESFDPAAFVMRRSMPWATAFAQGLEFIAYGNSLDHFERQLRRMCGLDDGIGDALFRFSRPLTGGYYWCPPVSHGRLDLTLLGL
jgi:putative iron-dependent peroxidase